MEKVIIEEIIKALKPLVDVANAYDQNDLDDGARKFWGQALEHINTTPNEDIILYTGRGGKTLITLQDCMVAREVSNKLQEMLV